MQLSKHIGRECPRCGELMPKPLLCDLRRNRPVLRHWTCKHCGTEWTSETPKVERKDIGAKSILVNSKLDLPTVHRRLKREFDLDADCMTNSIFRRRSAITLAPPRLRPWPRVASKRGP